MKHLEIRQKYSAACEETLRLMLDILRQQQCQTQHVGLKNSGYRTPQFQKIINDLLHVCHCGSLSNKDAK